MPADCLICRKHKGLFAVPGGMLVSDKDILASHAHMPEGQDRQYLGWLVLETRRHTPGLSDLTDSEGQAMGLWTARLSRALKELLDPEHIYAFVVGHGATHVHLHILPRYTGTPRQYWGIHVDEWPEAPRGNWHTIEKLCERIRFYLSTNN